jgi:hypothetical protein
MSTTLTDRVSGPVFEPTDDGFAEATAGFNVAFEQRPDLVVSATSVDDVQQAVRYARDAGMKLMPQGTGHGTEKQIDSGVLLTTAAFDRVSVDPVNRVATIGAGVRWNAVVAAAGGHGLTPITGSSPIVGATGYLLGGGVGPLARSHGFSADYVVGFTVVTGDGSVVEATADENPDLFWALRGGKFGLGVVVETRVRLVELSTVYGGSFFVDTPHIERMLRGWIDWTTRADDRVTTSMQLVRFPRLESVPEPMRGRLLASVRFAFPGDAAEGERLVAPLRGVAPVYLDMLGELPVTELGRIHNDPTDPIPVYVHGGMIDRADQGWASAALDVSGPGVNDPAFFAAELRHLGAATHRDAPGGTAVGGRRPEFAYALVGLLEHPNAEGRVVEETERWRAIARPWLSADNNINLMTRPITPERVAACWPADIGQRLGQVRRRYDPDGVTMGLWPSPSTSS